MNPGMLERLHAADDPTAYEAPADFDWSKAVSEVRALKPKLEALVGRSLELDDKVQDASFFADLAIYTPCARANYVKAVLVVRFSTFGRLFTVYDGCEEEARLPAQTISQVVERVEQEGFHYVDSKTLEEPYSGSHPYFVSHTWWGRFFDYL